MQLHYAMGPLIGLMIALFVVALVVRARVDVVKKFETSFTVRRPLGANGIVRGAEPVYLHGSASHAVLLIHGFGDTPQSVRPLADALHAAGWTVSAVLLPGHGRPLREFAAARSMDWIAHVQSSYRELCAAHTTVVVCGLSMGAALSTILAAEHAEIPAVALLAPYLAMSRDMQIRSVLARLLEFVAPYHANTGGDRSIHDAAARAQSLGTGVVTGGSLMALREISLLAQRGLPSIKARVLCLQSREDNRLRERDAVEQFARIGSATKEQRWLIGCGHVITVDYCKDEVARQVAAWFAPDFP